MALVLPNDGFVYHEHQQEGIRWMMRRERPDAPYICGGILADEMGLGKTWTTLGLILNSPVPRTLILLPPALVTQWTDACELAHLPCYALTPSAKGVAPSWSLVANGTGAGRAETRVYVATYDRAMRVTALLAETAWDRIMADEGHVFRNGESTQRFRKLSGVAAPRRWILSGTPIQNRKNDIGNLLMWCGMTREAWITTDTAVVANEVLLRRNVAEVRAVVGLPEKKPTHHVHAVTLPAESEELRVFNSLVGRFEYAVETNARNAIILELYLRIQQFTAHPSIYVDAMKRKFKAGYSRTHWDGTASKYEAIRDWILDAPRTNTIVFGKMKGELELAEGAFKSAGYATYMIRGGQSDAQRANTIRESREMAAAGTPIAICVQIVAGGAGLNLQHCQRVVFLSSHWNPAMVDQAVARAYRIGQVSEVDIHHFVMADSAAKNVDRIMASKHGLKRSIATSIHPKLICDTAIQTEEIMEFMGGMDEEVEDDDPVEVEA